MTTRGASAELLTVHALRLAGFADEEGIADRALLPDHRIRRVLDDAARAGHARTMSFADAHGWILTESGRIHLASLLEAEVEEAGARTVLNAVIERFDAINGEFVETVSRWQLRSTASTGAPPTGADAQAFDALLSHLSAFGDELDIVLAALVSVLPRFGRYPVQYALAVRRAQDEGLRWVTGVGLLSCHLVWAELHQDLLSTLGRER